MPSAPLTTTWSSRCSRPVTSTPRRTLDAELARATVEQPLDHRLVEHRRRRPTGRAVADPAEAQQRRAGRVAPLVDLRRLADLPHLVADPARLEDATDLVVEVHRTRQRVRLGPPLQHRDRAPELGEQDGEGVADRSVADDGDVDAPRSWLAQRLVAPGADLVVAAVVVPPVGDHPGAVADLDLEPGRRLQVEAEHPVVVVAARARSGSAARSPRRGRTRRRRRRAR